MKLKDIINEMPSMVPHYPFDKQSQNTLDAATHNPDNYEEKYTDGDISFRESKNDSDYIVMFSGDQAIGHMALAGTPIEKHLGHTAHQVADVWIHPEYRNKGLGIKLYNYVLKVRKEGFASGAAMTPDSRRIYTSMLNDSSVSVFGVLKDKESGDYKAIELSKGENGITTGNADDDEKAFFVIIPR